MGINLTTEYGYFTIFYNVTDKSKLLSGKRLINECKNVNGDGATVVTQYFPLIVIISLFFHELIINKLKIK